MTVRRLLAGLMLASLAPACADSSGPDPEGDVMLEDNAFVPSAITVDAGTTVTWAWSGNSPHNVTWVGPGAPAPSHTQIAGTYERLFRAAGTYDYYCTIHGTPTSGMRGSVTVP